MLEQRLALPFPIRVLNTIGETLRAMKVPLAELSEASVCKAAKKQTGLSDFGDPYYREGLLTLLDSTENDANLHFLGRFAYQRWIVSNLCNRLLLVETRRRKPEIFDRPLLPPIIILGLPRSGTTLLHRMLAIDSAHRGVPMWELMRPIPPVDDKPDRRRKVAEQEFNLNKRVTFDVDRKHFIRPDQPEECMWMLGLTFLNLSFWMLGPVYGYVEWYMRQNLFQKKYQDYRWLLQVLQAAEPARRLTLKAPEHLGKLDVLQQMVPEAMLIQTHRDPVTVTNSLNSLFYSAHAAKTDHSDPRRTADANLSLLEWGATQNMAARDRLPQPVYDVYYEGLVADPIGTAREVYDHFGLEWPENHEQRLQAYVRQNPKDKHGQHLYRAEDFGLTDDVIAHRFRNYRKAFGYAR